MTVHIPAAEAFSLRQSASGTALSRARASLENAKIERPRTRRRREAEIAFDTLEKRYLLSADISPYIDTLDDGLDRLETLAEDIETFELMANEVPVLGDSLGELANLSDTLRMELIDPLRDALSDVAAVDTSGDGLISAGEATVAIGNIAGVTSFAGLSTADEVSWEISFEKQLSLSELFPDFGTEFLQLGLDFSGSLGATIDLALDFGFGILLDPALSPVDAGFIDADSVLSVDADADFSALSDFRVGLLGGLTADVGGGASAGVNIAIDTAAAGSAGDATRLTIAEIDALGAGVLTAEIDLSETNFDATIDVDASTVSGLLGDLTGVADTLDGVDISFQLVDAMGNPATVFTATDVKLTIADDDLADFTRINSGTILTFLATLGDKLQTLSNAFQELTDFDLFDVSFDKIADYAQAFETLTSALSVPGLVGAINADLSVSGTPTFQISYTIIGADGAEVASGTTGNITFDFDAADVLAQLNTNINAALPASAPEVEAVLEQGRLVLRGIVDGASENVFADLSLQNVASLITDAVGWQEDQTALLLPTFRTIQDFAEAILDVPVISSALSDIGLEYVDGALTFNLDILNEIVDQSIAFNFAQGLSLGALGELTLTGSATADLDSEIALAFGAGVELSALAEDTLIADLNGGLGVGLTTSADPDLMFMTADGSAFSVTFDPAATTVGQLVEAINTEADGASVNVTGQALTFVIDDLGNGFKITDNTVTDTTTGRLSISGGSDSRAIYDLGFGFGLATEVGQTELFGDFVIQRFFIDPAATTMGASISATASDISLYGSLGFVTFGVQGGQLGGTLANDADLYGDRAGDTLDPLSFGLSLDLTDPNDDGRLYLREMDISERGGEATLDQDLPSANDQTIEIQLSDGTNVSVDLSGATTIADAVAAINAASADIETSLNAAGNAIDIIDNSGGSTQPFTIVDPGSDANSVTRQLGFALEGDSEDADTDGRITGATIGGFVAVDTVDFTADPITGELVLPVVLDGLEVLGLGTEPIVISVGFSKGSILTEASVDGDLTALFETISNLGTQDLFEIIGQIANVLNNEIDVFNADLPILGTSISDLLGAINEEFGDVIDAANQAIADGLVSLVDALEDKFAELVEALNPQAAIDFLDTVEAQTLLVALEDLRAVAENLATDGFDLLFDNVPGKLLSAAAALRGTFERIAKEAEEAGTNIYDTVVAEAGGVIDDFNDLIEQVDDISPNAETVLRILQEALGFDLPELDDVLSEALPTELANTVDAFLDEILGEADHASKTIQQIIDDIADYAEGAQQDVITKIEAFIADAQDAANGAVDVAVAKLQDILDVLVVRVIGDAAVAVGGLADELYEFGVTVEEQAEVLLEIAGDGIANAQQLIDAINAAITGTDLEGEVEAVLDTTGRFVLKSVGDAEKIVLSTVDSALETALGVVLDAESLAENFGALLGKLQNLDGATIFTIIKELPFISDVVQKLESVFKEFLTVDIDDIIDYAEMNAELGIDAVNDLIGGLQNMIDALVDNLRGSLLSVFGGGVLNFDVDTDTGQIDIGLHYAPSFYSLNPDDVDIDFSLEIPGGGGDLADFGFGAGFSESELTLDIGGYLDLGFVIDLIGSPDGGFGSDFDVYVDPDSAAGVTVDFAVAGQLQVQLGAVGVIFGSDDLASNDPFLTLTDLSGYGPAFLEVMVTGGTMMVDGRDLIAIGDAGIDATAQAKLNGTLFAYDTDEIAINWDTDGMGTIEQVSFGLMAEIDFTGGEFDFEFMGDPLEAGEFEAILQSLIEFDLSLILDAFEFFLDGLEDLLNYLAEAPIIGDGFDPIATAYETLNGYFQGFIDKVETLADENVEEFVRDAIFNLLGTVTIADGVSLGLFTDSMDPIEADNYETEIGVTFVGGPTLDDALTYLQGGNSPALIIDPLKIGLRLEQDVKFDFGLDALVVDVQGSGQVAVDLDLFLNIGFGLGLEEGAFLVMPEGDTKVFEGTFDASIEGDGTDPASLQLGLFFLGLEATPWEANMQDDYPDADFPDAPTLAEIKAEHPGTFDGTNDPRIAEGVGFSAMVALDLLDGGAPLGTATTFGMAPDDITRDIAVLTEIGDLGVETTFVVEVDIDLLLRGGVSFTSGDTVDENFPSLFTWLNIDWTWDFEGGDDNGLSVQFYDLSLDIGEALQSTIGPVADSILRFIEPLQPFLEFLNTPIPIISQLSELFGQDPVTFLDAIGFLGSGAESVQTFLDILVAVEDTLTALESLGMGAVNFGDFIVSASPGIDLRDLGSREMLQSDGLFNGNLAGSALIAATSEEDLNSQVDSASGGLFDGIFDPLNEFGLYLPFLQDPAQLFGVLFGQRIDFVIWDIPELSAEFGVSYKFGPILPPVPLFVTIAGGFEIFLDLAVGYDSRGLETGDFFDGFFFVDGALDGFNIDASQDPLELGVSVFFEATASLSVLVAEAGVTGGVEAIIGANWADRDGDGKFYLDELLSRASQGIFCIFDLEGALEAFLEAFVKLGFDTPFGFVTIFEDAFELLRVTLLDFSLSCPPLPPPDLGERGDDGSVILNIGTRAENRQAGADGNDDEYVQIFGDRVAEEGPTVSLWNSGVDDSYFSDGVLTRDEIEGNLGDFNQDLDINRDGNIDTDEILGALDIDGGDTSNGEYALIVGFGEWEIYRNITKIVGDAAGGDDEIVADCDSVLFDLEIYGGAGEDTLIGGQGEDTLIGGADADIVQGCLGDDLLLGDGTASNGSDADGFFLNITNFITGNGADAVYGGGGGDLMYGGGGNDTIRGDGDENSPDKSSDGADTIFGNEGEDQIDGFLGDDVILGGRGADNISGDQGDDTIRGDYDGITPSKSPDLSNVRWADANATLGEIDLIIGGEGRDFIRGDGGNDIIYGEDTDITGDEVPDVAGGFNDTIHGDGGDDEIRGQLGNDQIYGGLNNDRLIGGDGNDSIFGNAGADEIYGDRLGADELPPVSGDDYIEGGAAGDRIFGQDGEDWILGGIDTASVQGNFAVYAYTGSGDAGDTISGGDKNDIILGDDGTIASSESYSSQTDGTGGSDLIRAGNGDDQVAGGRGADTIFGDPSGGNGQDILVGDEVIRSGILLESERNAPATGDPETDLADKIYGYGGNDIIIAGGGNDTAFGSLGDDIIAGDYARLNFKATPVENLFDDTAFIYSIDPGFGGNDRLIGDSGADIILGGFGDDQVFGGGVNDDTNILFGDNGLVVRDIDNPLKNDVFSIAGDLGGDDIIVGGNVVDIAIGGTGDDTILTLQGTDIALGDAGFVLRNDGLFPERVSTSFFGTTVDGTNVFEGLSLGLNGADPLATGQDFIDAGSENDIAMGGLDADLIFGRTGDDVLLGDNGEVLYNGAGAGLAFVTAVRTVGTDGGIDAIFGEAGGDIAFAGAEGDYVFGDLTASIDRDGDDFDVVGATFEAVTGAGNDILGGDFGELLLSPAGVYDVLQSTDPADGGSDLIEGHEGDDIAFGGAFGDEIHGEAAASRYGLLADGAFGSDTLIGDSGYIDFDVGSATGYDVIRTDAAAIGGSDVILGNEGADIVMGGMAGDFLYGDRIANVDFVLATRLTDIELSADGVMSGEDTILGDNGEMLFEQTADTVAGRNDVNGFADASGMTTVIQSTVNAGATDGGNDLILGDGMADLIMGGLFADRIWGDEGGTGNDEGDDLIFGDNGLAWQRPGKGGALEIGDDYFGILTAANQGLGDAIFAEGGEDTVMGQQGDDVIFGGMGDDNLIGGHTTEGGIDELDSLTDVQISAITGNDTAGSADLAVLDPTDLPNVNDVIDGEEGEDIIAGDNAYLDQWGGQGRLVGTGEGIDSLRFQELLEDANLYSMTGALIDVPLYADTDFFLDLGFVPNIVGTGYDFGILNRNLYLLDFDKPTQDAAAADPTVARPFGDDVITGGIGDDEVYGGLGDDVIQGDGLIEIGPNFTDVADIAAGIHTFKAFEGDTGVLVNPDPNATATNDLRFVVGSSAEDGDDYIEGNGGNDRLYGNLGQDDIIGGSSGLAAIPLNSDVAPIVFEGADVYPGLRPDGADLIYGGSADAGWLTRNADYTTAGDSLVDETNFHTADADMILGDNGNIYRLVDDEGDPLTFNYASGMGYDGLEIRVVELLDYAYTVADPGGDGVVDWKTTFHNFGNGAGDLIHGESGDDIIHGMTGDDLIFGEAGDDDVYGQSGADVLYGGRGVDGIMGDDGLFGTSRNGLTEELIGLDTANLQEVIRTPGNLQVALIYRSGDLLKDATMIAFDHDGVNFGIDWQNGQVTSSNDIIFGGWENDFLHSGDGDDAVTGAEALPIYYNANGSSFGAVNTLLEELQGIDPAALAPAQSPFWSAFGLVNPGDILAFGATDPEEFALYDENDPRSKIVLNLAGFVDVDFILNNDASEGPQDMTFTYFDNRNDDLRTDGADHLFGDLGNDWIVGGTGRDHMFGGRGSDLLQMDDDLSTENDANTDPDAYQEYADIAYDGAGRDYLILNTGADRAIGWIGEYNSYIVPFSPFGAFHIARLLQPQTEQFVLDLADASGADESTSDILRFAEQAAVDDKLDNPLDPEIYDERKGSPFNELGMVRQEDFDWQDQSGPPDDPQAGNLKGKREIKRREIWDGDNTATLQAQLNELEAAEWYLVEQAWAEVFADDYTLSIPGDILIAGTTQWLGTIGEGDDIFRTVTMEATIDLDKPGKKHRAEAYFLYDMVDSSNFKFAGFDAKSNEIVVGRVVNGEWIVTDKVNQRIKTGFDHNLRVLLEESTVKVLFNDQLKLTSDLGEDLTDGAYAVAAPGIQVFFHDISVTATPKIDVAEGEPESEGASASAAAAAATIEATSSEAKSLSVDWSSTEVVETGSSATAPAVEGSEPIEEGAPLTFTSTDPDDIDFTTTDSGPSSDGAGEEEEVVTVKAWAPRDDFAA